MQEFELLCEEIAEHYGEAKQLNQLQEELAELIVAVNKYRRDENDVENLIEEIADVEIMLQQIKNLLHLNPEYIEMIRARKLIRQKKRIQEEKPEKRIIVIETDISEEEIIGIKEQIAEFIPDAKVVEVK